MVYKDHTGSSVHVSAYLISRVAECQVNSLEGGVNQKCQYASFSFCNCQRLDFLPT